MIKSICKYYLKFPPVARNVIDFSFKGFMGYMGVEFFHPSPEHILLDVHEMLNKN